VPNSLRSARPRPSHETRLQGLIRDRGPERACRHLTYCSEILSPAPNPRAQAEAGGLSDVGTGRPLPQVKILLIAERVDGFFLERLTDSGELLRATRHDTLDEAMRQAYSEYDAISDWRFCPDDADPLESVQRQSDP
jgi:hypothetical protein